MSSTRGSVPGVEGADSMLEVSEYPLDIEEGGDWLFATVLVDSFRMVDGSSGIGFSGCEVDVSGTWWLLVVLVIEEAIVARCWVRCRGDFAFDATRKVVSFDRQTTWMNWYSRQGIGRVGECSRVNLLMRMVVM